jgi:hypothetical protein
MDQVGEVGAPRGVVITEPPAPTFEETPAKGQASGSESSKAKKDKEKEWEDPLPSEEESKEEERWIMEMTRTMRTMKRKRKQSRKRGATQRGKEPRNLEVVVKGPRPQSLPKRGCRRSPLHYLKTSSLGG